jgi:hypothetical protein
MIGDRKNEFKLKIKGKTTEKLGDRTVLTQVFATPTLA